MKIEMDGVEAHVTEADKYLQINDISALGLGRIWGKLQSDYADYDKCFCYHNNEPPVDVLSGIGAVLCDDCIEMRMNARQLAASDTPGITRVTKEAYAEFAAFHDARHPDMYWTSARIVRDLSRWAIFASHAGGHMTGYILLAIGNSDTPEIFCVDSADSAQCEALMQSAVEFAFRGGKKEVLYMADDEISHQAALAVGFAVTGFYKGYLLKHAE